MKPYFLSLFFTFLATSASYSQLDKPLRTEIVLNSEYYPFAMINLEEKGLIVHSATGDANKTSQNTTQDFILYDAYLRQKKQIRTAFPVEYAVVNHALDGEKLSLVLRNQTYRNTYTPTFLMNINLSDGAYTIDTLYSLAQTPTFAGFIYRSRVWLVQIDRSDCSVNTTKTGDTLLFKYDFPKFSNQELIDAALDTVSNKLFVLYGDASRRDNYITLNVFDTLSNLLWSKNIVMNEENTPVQAKLHFNKNGKCLIYGTYNLSSERQRVETVDKLLTSTGFFHVEIADTFVNLLSMRHFADFDSVDSHISPDQLQHLQRKRNRRQQPFSMDALISLQLQTIGKNSFLVGENVSRKYRTATQTYYDYYGRAMPYTTTVFDGYSFNDVYVWMLDSNGNVLKNYISDISTTLHTTALFFKTAYFTGQNEVMLLFANATNVFFKTLQPYEKSYQTLKLEALHKGDKIVEDHDSRIVNWYGPHFLVCGYQTIQNNNLKGANKRMVFYLSKVTLD